MEFVGHKPSFVHSFIWIGYLVLTHSNELSVDTSFQNGRASYLAIQNFYNLHNDSLKRFNE